MKIHPVGEKFFRADGHRQTGRQADRQNEANSGFSQIFRTRLNTNMGDDHRS